MGKFVIECPECKKFVEVRSGVFAKKKITCSCGNEINVRTDRMASGICPQCGNNVVFDQSKGDKALCPVCHTPINTVDATKEMAEFSCRQCGIRLRAAVNAPTYKCPVCDFENDVQDCLKREQIKHDGQASVIKYEGDNNTLVWKHPIEDFNWGSQLIVHESQEAVFFRDGQALDTFGPGRYTLETQQLPMLEKFYKLPSDSEKTFHSEVYFINKTVQMAIPWGTADKVRFIDPLTSFPVELGASGEMNIQVSNSRKLLIKVVGTMSGVSFGESDNETESDGFSKSLRKAFRPLISNAVRTNLSAVIKNENIDLLEVDMHLDTISSDLKDKVQAGLEEYGVTVPQFYVTTIVLPENDPNFQKIRQMHTVQGRKMVAEAEKEAQTAEELSRAAIAAAHREVVLQEQTTQTEVKKREAEREVIAAQAEAQAARVKGLTEAEIMRVQGYNKKDILQAEVQEAYAAGIGQMGSGGGGGGSSSLGDMLGLGVGLAAAGAIAPQIGGMFQGMNPNNQTQPTDVQAANAADFWNCSCGQIGNTTKFCPNCGQPRPVLETWNCSCGQMGITSKFCPNCGNPRPASSPASWDCSCGHKGNTGKFCEECGKPREE